MDSGRIRISTWAVVGALVIASSCAGLLVWAFAKPSAGSRPFVSGEWISAAQAKSAKEGACQRGSMAFDLVDRRLLIGMSAGEVDSLLGGMPVTTARGFAAYSIGLCPEFGWRDSELRLVFDGMTGKVISVTFYMGKKMAYSDIALTFAGVAFLLAMIAMPLRSRHKRTFLVATGAMMFTLGLWLLVSTLEAQTADRAHVFSRHVGYLIRSSNPELFWYSVWFHSLLAVLSMSMGMLAILMPFTKRWGQAQQRVVES